MCAAKKAIETVRSSRMNSPTTPGAPELPTAPWHKRIVDSIIGEKGGMEGCGDGSKFVNPVARLKLLLVRLQLLWIMIIALVLTVCCRSLLSSRYIFSTSVRHLRQLPHSVVIQRSPLHRPHPSWLHPQPRMPHFEFKPALTCLHRLLYLLYPP